MKKLILLSLLVVTPLISVGREPAYQKKFSCHAISTTGELEKVFPFRKRLRADSEEEAIRNYLREMSFDDITGEYLTLNKQGESLKVEIALVQRDASLKLYEGTLKSVECSEIAPVDDIIEILDDVIMVDNSERRNLATDKGSLKNFEVKRSSAFRQ